MRFGVFGGTFDPIHLGHLIMAEQCRDQANLDRVLFIPAARPPHKEEEMLAPFDKRVEMISLAISGYPPFVISELEKDRPGPSYTVDTLQHLRSEYPDGEFFLLIGGDTLLDLPGWYKPKEIIDLATLLVLKRPGWEIPRRDTIATALGLEDENRLRMTEVEMPQIDISSRDIRQRLSTGRSIRYLVPRAIEAYIADRDIYHGMRRSDR